MTEIIETNEFVAVDPETLEQVAANLLEEVEEDDEVEATEEDLEDMLDMIIEDLLKKLTDARTTSAYGVAMLQNAIAKQLNLRELPTQYLYNYSANGMIVSKAKKGVNGDHKYNKVEIATWLKRHFMKALTK